MRKIVEIDEEKCDGCGLCVPGCAEGALQIVDGKAKLVSEVYCDGLGACLGECPRDAIRIVEREAAEFDEAAVQRHSAAAQHVPSSTGCPGSVTVHGVARAVFSAPREGDSPIFAAETVDHGARTPFVPRKLGQSPRERLPGSRPQTFSLPLAGPNHAPASAPSGPVASDGGARSSLGHWPVQLRLISPGAPFLRNAHLLLVADCVPVAMPDFQRLIEGRAVAVACPKLDDAREHVGRLAAILAEAAIESITVVHMEVPCCSGLRSIAQAAMEASGREVPLADVTVSLRGEVLR